MIAASTANEKIVVFIGWILSFSRLVNSAIAGLKGPKTATGRSVLRPIQIRLTASSLVKSHQPVSKLAANANRRFQFQKSRQLFIRTHNEAVTVAAVRVCNPDRSSVAINRLDEAPTPTRFLEIVSDDFPIFHVIDERGSFS